MSFQGDILVNDNNLVASMANLIPSILRASPAEKNLPIMNTLNSGVIYYAPGNFWTQVDYKDHNFAVITGLNETEAQQLVLTNNPTNSKYSISLLGATLSILKDNYTKHVFVQGLTSIALTARANSNYKESQIPNTTFYYAFDKLVKTDDNHYNLKEIIDINYIADELPKLFNGTQVYGYQKVWNFVVQIISVDV
jgi:hypothetical protein